MKSLAKEFVIQNKPLINYIRDKNGFKKGVVVALDANHIGWSLVSKEDYKLFRGKLSSLPKVKRLVDRYASRIEDMGGGFLTIRESVQFFSEKLLSFDTLEVVYEPKFDRDTGLSIAINRALNDEPRKSSDIPADKDLIETLNHMIRRSAS